MAATIVSLLAIIAFFPLVIFLGFYVHFKLVSSKYWAKRNVAHLKPIFILGNIWKATILENLIEMMTKFHLENKKKKLLGMWMFNKPQLLVTDLDIARRILVKDFQFFRDRGIEINTKLDPLGGHLFLLNGKPWRNLRVKLTPTFTSGKMKMMFPTLVDCGVKLENHLKKLAEGREPVEVKDLTARFTTDIISSCAFGIETNSLENPNSEFREFGRKILQPSFLSAIIATIATFYPKFTSLFSIRLIPKDASDFFINAVKETVDYRENNNITRNDFLQLIIQLLRAGKVEDADKKTIDVEGMDDETLVQKFSLLEAAAQCFVFFVGGFETSSSALTFGLYELALHPEVQMKLQKEIDETTKNGVSYEETMSMKYLDMVVQEILRKYPSVGNLQRISNAEYHIPELNVTLDKGTTVIFAVKGFHLDPDNFEDPEKFDPERFSEENQSLFNKSAYMPFGDGPRNCIGNRFALMQMKVALIYILKSLNVEVTKKTSIPFKYDPKSFVPMPLGGMHLAFTHRKSN